MSLKVIDFFAGAGGLSHGFQQAGFDITGGTDIEEKFRKTYEENHDASYLIGDVTELSTEDILDEFGVEKGEVDVVIGGPPCQGFSLAKANRDPGDSRNQLVSEYIRKIYEIQPRWFVMENVKGLATMEDGQVLDYALEMFREKLGYKTEYKILNSSHYGAPQTRERVIIIGNKEGEGIPFPDQEYGDNEAQTSLEDIGSKEELKPARTIRDAFSDLPSLGPGEEKRNYASDPKCSYQEEMRKNSEGLRNHNAPNHGEKVVNRISKAEPGEKIPYDSWTQKRRLSWDEPAGTLLAGPRPTYHFGHPEDPRGLSIRERARIQSFPDNFIFYGPVAKQRQQTGNAVPPLLSKAIAKELKEVM